MFMSADAGRSGDGATTAPPTKEPPLFIEWAAATALHVFVCVSSSSRVGFRRGCSGRPELGSIKYALEDYLHALSPSPGRDRKPARRILSCHLLATSPGNRVPVRPESALGPRCERRSCRNSRP